MRVAVAVAAAAAIGALAVPSGATPLRVRTHATSDRYTVRLASRTFVPHGFHLAAIARGRTSANGRIHFLLQVRHAPTAQDARSLTRHGVDLVQYIGGDTYVASAPRARLDVVGGLPNVRAVEAFRVGDKVAPGLERGTTPPWARVGRHRVALLIGFNPDVARRLARAELARIGGRLLRGGRSSGVIAGIFPRGAAARIARLDEVQWVKPAEAPLEEKSVGAALAVGAPTVWGAPYGLTGSGVTALVYDGGTVLKTHPDFGSRVVETLDNDPSKTYTGLHATNVAGIIGGDGTASDGAPAGATTALTAAASAGATEITVKDPLYFGGTTIEIGTGATKDDVMVLTGAGHRTVKLVSALAHDHAANEAVRGLNGGFIGEFAGVAPGVSLRSYAFDNDGSDLYDQVGQFGDNLAHAIAAGTDVANLSIGNTAATCDRYGNYSAFDVLLDNAVRGGLGAPLPIAIAAGNERDSSNGAPACGDYFTLDSSASAKNTISVGAINADGTMTSFSSWGPTDDARIKPDLVAPGSDGGLAYDRGIKGPGFWDLQQPQPDGTWAKPNGHLDNGLDAFAPIAEPQNGYVALSGTSQATPIVTGAMSLLTQEWRNAYGEKPSPATLKAILIHTAKRAGPAQAPAAGGTWGWPNFEQGWGQLDVKAAVDLVKQDVDQDVIDVDTIAQTRPATKNVSEFMSDGSQDVRVTLAWDDPPGSVLGNLGELVNDLDLELVDPSGQSWKPWQVTAPRAASTRAADAVNNVEMVTAPKMAGEWQVVVTGTALHAPGAQQYTVIRPPLTAGISVSDVSAAEGDSGTHDMTFTVSLTHPEGSPQSVSYNVSGGTATEGTDFQPTSGTLTFAPGEIDKVVAVPIVGDTDAEGNETLVLTLSNAQPFQPIGQATATGTILDDDGMRNYTLVGGTGIASAAGAEPYMSINDDGKVAFVGDRTGGGYGIWVGDGASATTLINPSWSDPQRVFENPRLDDAGSVVAWDRRSGAPPSYFIRSWSTTALDSPTDLARGGSAAGADFDGIVSPTWSRSGSHLAFTAISGNQTFVASGPHGATGQSPETNLSAPRPLNDDDGNILFRRLVPDSTGLRDPEHASIVLASEDFLSRETIACTTGCIHPGFTNVGWLSGLSDTGRTVVFYGDYSSPPPNVDGGPGIFASIVVNGARKLVRLAKLGDAGITAFEPRQRIGVNATLDQPQHAFSSVFVAYGANNVKGLYKARIQQKGVPASPTFEVDLSQIARVGDSIPNLGQLTDLSLDDRPINDRDDGDVVFWGQAGSSTGAVLVRAPEIPVLFVPGVAGSSLWDRKANKNVWVHFPWPGNDAYLGQALSLREEDRQNYDIVPDNILETAVGQPIYKPLIDALVGAGYKKYDIGAHGEKVTSCDRDQAQNHPTLFVFPYDWRLSNAQNATRLKGYMDCIQAIYPGTKVNVVSHSMGGLLTRRTVTTQPDFRKHVNTWIALMPPWLGAPKLIYVLRTGDFLRGLGGTIAVASGPGVQRAVESLVGPQQLMPSRAYYDVAKQLNQPLPYGEDGRDFNGNGVDTEIYDTFDETRRLLDREYPRFHPATVADAFHTPQQDNFSGDDYPYKFYEIWGQQTDPNTVGQVLETTKPICQNQAVPPSESSFPKKFCDLANPMELRFVLGDGTVPSISAARTAAMQPPGAVVREMDQAGGDPESVSHNGIIGNTDLHSQVIMWLEENGGPKRPTAARIATTGVQPVRRLVRPRVKPSRKPIRRTASVRAVADTVRSIAVYGAVATTTDATGARIPVAIDPATEAPTTAQVPDTDVYYLGGGARLFRTTLDAPLKTSFTVGTNPVAVEVTTENASGVVTSATRYEDVTLAAGSNVELSTATIGAPQLAADTNGDGTFETAVQPTTSVSGTDAADTTPPTLTGSTTRGSTATTVALTAADTGSGVSAVYYSLDGRTFTRYTAPFTIDPTTTMSVLAFADDRAGNRSEPVKVEVSEPPALQPTALDLAVATDEDTPLTIKLASISSRGGQLTYSFTQPAHGTLVQSGGNAVYTPGPDYNGTDSFTYSADDGFRASSAAAVTITVRPVNDAPRANLSGPASIDEGAAAATFAANATDPEGDAITYAWSATGGTLTGAGPTATLAGPDGPAAITLTLKVTDSQGASSTYAKDVAVRNVPPTVSPGAAATVYWGLPLLFSGSATDASAADRAAGLGASWSFGDNTVPAAAFSTSHVYANAGSYAATLTATDKDGGVGSANRAITVSKRGSSLVYTGSTAAPYGYAKLSAKLADTVDGASAALAGHGVTFVVGTLAFAANTDAVGVAAPVLATPIGVGSYSVSTRFAGDAKYNPSTAPVAALKVSSSPGTAAGTGLVLASNGATATFNVSSADGVTIRGTLDYAAPGLSIHATQFAPFGVAPDGHSAWFNGVAASGQKLVVNVQDNGPGSADVFNLWVNGALQTGTGALAGGDEVVSKT